MKKTSAGLLMFRRAPAGLEVLLAHPGGPFWARKDLGAWSIPKGEVNQGENPLAAAQREFLEETGFAGAPPFIDLGEVQQPGGKMVRAWAFESDCDPAAMVSNQFEMEWPPKSGMMKRFPEVDRVAWFGIDEARRRILRAQLRFVETLAQQARGAG